MTSHSPRALGGRFSGAERRSLAGPRSVAIFGVAFAVALTTSILAVTLRVSAVWRGMIAAIGFIAAAALAFFLGVYANRVSRPRPASNSDTVLDALTDYPLELRNALEEVLGEAAEAIARLTAIASHRIGMHCFIIYPAPEGRVLERVARYRNGTAPPLPRRFLTGHGLVGWCWQEALWCDEDLRRFRPLTLDRYEALGVAERKGRTFEELRSSVSIFSLIAATPMVERNLPPVRGVVSVNFDNDVTTSHREVLREDVRARVEAAARGCARLLGVAGVFRRVDPAG